MELAAFTAGDFPLLASWFHSEADVVQWGGPLVHHPLDALQMAQMLDETRTDPARRRCWMCVNDGRVVGHIQAAFDWRNGNASIQRVAIDPARRGEGLAAPMLRLALREAFADPAIHRVELNVYSFNAPALRTYAAVGFTLEGTRRAATLVGGERWDACLMSILRPEHERQRE
jgi:RimJ/RimL family protein N-acetyltransferase